MCARAAPSPFLLPQRKIWHPRLSPSKVVGPEVFEADEAEDLSRDEKGRRDGALQKVSHRLLQVHLFGDGGVGVGALEAVLVHREARKHDLPPQTGLGQENRAQRRERAHLLGEVVAVDLEVDKALDSLGVVPEPVVPVVLVQLGPPRELLRTGKHQLAAQHHRQKAALHLRGWGDGPKGGPRKAEKGETSVGAARVQQLLVQEPRVHALFRELTVPQTELGAKHLIGVFRVEEEGERVPIAGAGDHHVALELAPVVKLGTVGGEREALAVQLRALGHNGCDEALVLAPKLGEGAGALLEVELPDGLQHEGLLLVRAVAPTLGHKLLGVLIRPPHPVAQNVRVRVPDAVGVEVGDPSVGLLSRDEVPVLSPDHDRHLGGVVGNLVADVASGFTCSDNHHPLSCEHLGAPIVLRVNQLALERLLPFEVGHRGPIVGAGAHNERVEGVLYGHLGGRLLMTHPHPLPRPVVQVLVVVAPLHLIEAAAGLAGLVESLHHLLAAHLFGRGAHLWAVQPPEQKDRAVGPRVHLPAERQVPAARRFTPVRLLHPGPKLNLRVQPKLVRKSVEVPEVLLVGPEARAVFETVRVVRKGREQTRGGEQGTVVRLGVHAADPGALLEAGHLVPRRGELFDCSEAGRPSSDDADMLLAFSRCIIAHFGLFSHSRRSILKDSVYRDETSALEIML
mmetsp:Transcript_31644/g.71136  ORF Transcript_31644/g.71136 Transcript_31644/m.71136 type:complete len:682 (+) Transcript_31644:199-2244(+)